MRPLPSCDSEA
jgi:hypothetical protein